MLLIDTNILLYARISNYPQHHLAKTWLEDQVHHNIRMGLPWFNLIAFLRIFTNPRVYRVPLPLDEALNQVDEWLNLPNVWIPAPTVQHQAVLKQISSSGQLTGNYISDAHLAALAIEHGLEVCTTDSDFAKFPNCKWRNPLSANN